MSQPLSGRLQAGIRLLPDPLPAAPWAGLTAGCPRRAGMRGWEGDGLTTFRRSSAGGEGRSSPPVVPRLRQGITQPLVLTTCLLAQAYQHLWLVVSHGVYRCFTWVDLSTRSWLPTALMLAVAASARASATLLSEEATLSRELRTSPLPGTHVPVGYCWQNSRCYRSVLRPQHSYHGDLVSHG
jgi:hypothetical protein